MLKWQTGIVCVTLVFVYLSSTFQSSSPSSSYVSRHLLGAQDDKTKEEKTRPNINDTNNDSSADDALLPPDLFTKDQLKSGFVVFHVVGVLYMFYALAIVCDEYFVPSLELIIDRFEISNDVAGATLMAAGGSAPELFTSLIGVFFANSDVGTGTIVGSAVFNVLFVIAACAFASEKALSLTAWPLIRDTFFYSIGLAMLVGFFVDSYVEWYEALFLFLWYLAYVLFMKYNSKAEAKFLSLFPGQKKEEGSAGDGRGWGWKYPGRKPLFDWMKVQVKEPGDGTVGKPGGIGGIVELKKKLEKGNDEDKEKEVGDENQQMVEQEDKTKEDEQQDEATEQEYKDPIMGGPPKDSSMHYWIWWLTLPLLFPMWLTIPDPNNPKRHGFYQLTFILSIFWIGAFSYLMVWWTTVVGNTAGIPPQVMGLTFLAAGTSIPDLITSVLVAKEGKGDMAVSSSIGSNIFDICVGMPVPWLLWSASQGGVSKKIDSEGMGCNVGMLFVMLIIVFASIMGFKWKMTKAMGGLMMVMYAIFLTFSLLFSYKTFECPI